MAEANNTQIMNSMPRLFVGATGITMYLVSSSATATRILGTSWNLWQAAGNTQYSVSGANVLIVDDNELTISKLIKANGGGVQFPATQVPSANANTLDDYKEGTWTPIDSSGASLVLSGASGVYTKIGRLVTVSGVFTFPSNGSGANIAIGGLPYTAAANSTGSMLQGTANTGDMLLIPAGTSTLYIYTASLARRTNANYASVAVYMSASYII